MINIDTPVGPFRTNTIMFQDVIMALEYNVLAPMQRGELFYRKNALPFGQHKAVKGQTFVLQLVDDFIEGTCEIANAQPHNTMLRQILAVIHGDPRIIRTALLRSPLVGLKSANSSLAIPEWVLATEAWATMPPGPRVLYVELKRRYNGGNNGLIYLSHRDAAKACNVHRNTIGGWFSVLEERGFIAMTRGPHLGPSGVGIASTWALTEYATQDGRRPTNAFKEWKSPAQKPCKPVTKTVRPCLVHDANAQKL